MAISCQSNAPYLWSVTEYHQLIKNRLIGVQGPTELISGRIICPCWQQQSAHQVVVQQLRLGLKNKLKHRVLVRSQQPVLLGVDSEPKPDIAIVLGGDARYEHHMPTPVEIALIIEVTEGDLVLDSYLKAIDYAEAGIPDYWVFDIKRQQLYVFRDIFNGSYCETRVLGVGESISPLWFPELTMTICKPTRRCLLTRYGRRQSTLPATPFMFKWQETAPSAQLATSAANASTALVAVGHGSSASLKTAVN
ncbi:MAG: Uma2 family endonuclease [Cyanobacteria bacterium P01_G01_bin.38]